MSDDEKWRIDPRVLEKLGETYQEECLHGVDRWAREDVTISFPAGSADCKLFEADIIREAFDNNADDFRRSCVIREEGNRTTYSFINAGRIFDRTMPLQEAEGILHKGKTGTMLAIAEKYNCRPYSRRNTSQSIQ